MNTRKVARVVTGIRTEDGAGVKLTRVIGHDDVKDFDPFLMLDAFDSRNPDDYTAGFPWHPHRGIETVTYLISGNIEHGDSLGNQGCISDGSCQWMTAGGGIIHREMPKPSQHMLGAQLWINLPKKDKMTAPPTMTSGRSDCESRRRWGSDRGRLRRIQRRPGFDAGRFRQNDLPRRRA